MEICPWKAIDSPWLKDALREFLTAGVERGGELLPTSRNCSSLLALGLSAAASGDPALVAVVGGSPVGFVLWVGAPPTLDLRWRTLIAHGSYTEPAYRHQRIARTLRAEAMRIAKARGYERVMGMVHTTNIAGRNEMWEHLSGRETAIQMEVVF